MPPGFSVPDHPGIEHDPRCRLRELQSASPGESSAVVRARVLAARDRQRTRGCLNAQLPPSRLQECCALDLPERWLVTDAVDRGGTSARAVRRATRVARTIADLAGEESVILRALAEALQYRAYEARCFATQWSGPTDHRPVRPA